MTNITNANELTNNDLSFLNMKDQMATKDEAASQKTYQRLNVNATRKETQDIVLKTKEGDTVTISALSKMSSHYMSFDYSSMVKGTNNGKSTSGSSALHGETFDFSTENRFEMNVQGDLNEEEKADIQKVIGELDNIMEDLVSGDMGSIIQHTMGLIDDTDTISGINAVLEFQQSVSMERRSVYERTGVRNGLTKANGYSPEDNNSTDSNLTSEKTNFFNSIIAKITESMKSVIEKSSVETSKLKNPIDELFSGVMNKLSQDNPQDKIKSQLLEQVQKNLANLLPSTSTDSQNIPNATIPETV